MGGHVSTIGFVQGLLDLIVDNKETRLCLSNGSSLLLVCLKSSKSFDSVGTV